MRECLPHQLKALEYCRNAPGGNVALFMEMRLGKTKVIIEWLRNVKGKILVIAPLSVVRSWAEELEKEGETRPELLLGATKAKLEALTVGLAARRKWYLTNIEGLSHFEKVLSDYRWEAIIVDESTKIKNPKAQVTKLLISHRGNANRRAILSGNPNPEGPLDLCEQFRFLYGSFMGLDSYWKFRNVAFFPVGRGYEWILKAPFRQRIRDYIQKYAFVLKRSEVGLANQKFYETRTVEMEPEQKRLMERLENEFALELPSGEEKLTSWVPVKLAWMARLAGGYLDGKKWFDRKVGELEDILTTELCGESVVVWFRFNAEIRRVAERLRKNKAFTGARKIGIIDGTVDETSRASIRRAFQNGELQTLLCQSKVGMFGLDLSRASTAIYFSNNYSSEIRTQSEDRIEHPLKKEPLLIIDMVTSETVDEDVVKALRRKGKESEKYLMKELTEKIRERTLCRA